MKFEARVMAADGVVASMPLEAEGREQASAWLRAQGYAVLSVQPARSARVLSRGAAFSAVLFCEELHALLTAGLGVKEALELMVDRRSHRDGVAVIALLLASIEQGQRLSGALQSQPERFSALLVGLVRSAEATSDLPQALSRYLEHEGRLGGLKHKLISAAIYPAILLGVGFAVAGFLMGYVVPRFAAVYRSGERELPWASELLLQWGDLIGRHSSIASVVLFMLLVLCGTYVQRIRRDGHWWMALRVLPGAASKLDALDLSRLYLTLGMLLQGGLPILQALSLASTALSPAKRPALARVAVRINEGGSLTEALRAEGLTTVTAQRLLSVGERSGQLAELLVRTATFHESEAARWIDRFSKVFEPVLMAAIGLLIGLIVLLLYMPIFDLAGSLQ